MTSITLEPQCEECGKRMFGRTDKRFCNDSCRNAFNRKKKAAEKELDNKNIPQIFQILKNNYEILKTFGLRELNGEKKHLTRKELLNKGFDERYCTSVNVVSYSEIWMFCFEFGFRRDGNNYYECYWAEYKMHKIG